MRFIKKIFGTFQSDKKLHFLVGAIVSLTCVYNIILSLVLVQAIAIGKEFYDSLNEKKHTVDMNDYMATVAGSHITLTAYALMIYYGLLM